MSIESHGTARESQVREIAAKLGVADFVYSAHPVQKGPGQREASGDGLLLVGDSGAILQVKARDPSLGTGDTVQRAANWIRKHADKAAKQGNGTRRELARRRDAGSPMLVYPVRAASMTGDAKERYALSIEGSVEDWPVLVILDHPQMPKVDLGFQDDVIWLTFADWRHVQRYLRSTHATLHYVRRVLKNGLHVQLGDEEYRYATLLSADERATEGSPTSVPYLADMENFDEVGTNIFHDVIDKVWPDDGIVPWQSASEYRSIVEFLDSVPPRVQSEVGRWFLQKRSEIAKGQHTSSGLVRLDREKLLVFACSHFRHWRSQTEWMAEFTVLTNIRHLQAIESGASDKTVALGVGALVEDRAGRRGVAYGFVMQKGFDSIDPIPENVRSYIERQYGIYNHVEGRTLLPEKR